ncbi:MAG: hypothetical protein AAGG50_09490 [Bacteroidota bacterium]
MHRFSLLVAAVLITALLVGGCDSSTPDPVDSLDDSFRIAVVAETPDGTPIEGLNVAIRPCFSVQVGPQDDACYDPPPDGDARPSGPLASAGAQDVSYTQLEIVLLSQTESTATIAFVWETQDETDNRGFDVQIRLPDEDTFTTLGFVDGAGTTNESQSYRYDTEVPEGLSTLRLRQEDVDGTSTLSPEVAFSFAPEAPPAPPSSSRLFGAFPTPFFRTSLANIEVGTDNPTVTLEVADLSGATTEIGTLTRLGNALVEWDATSFPSGVYFFRLRAGDALLDSVATAHWSVLGDNATTGPDVRGQTNADGRLETASVTLAPAFYGPDSLEYRDENNNWLGDFPMPPRVRITLIDPATGRQQVYDRDLVDGPNLFTAVWTGGQPA